MSFAEPKIFIAAKTTIQKYQAPDTYCLVAISTHGSLLGAFSVEILPL